MGLTVTEREHWKDRIAKRIDKAIVATYSEEEPQLLQRVKDEAKRQAVAKLGLSELMEQRNQLLEEIGRLEKKRDDVTKRVASQVTGRPVNEVRPHHYRGFEAIPREVEEAVEEAAASIEERLLAEHPLGSRVLQLRQEKEELLDTVWLATSGRQIKELWTSVSERLDQAPTPLQAEALRIAPDDTDS